MMNASCSRAESAAGEPGQQSQDQAGTEDDLGHRQHPPDDVGDRGREQLVAADRGHAGLGFGDLQQARPEPDAADDEASHQPHPSQHATTVGAGPESSPSRLPRCD